MPCPTRFPVIVAKLGRNTEGQKSPNPGVCMGVPPVWLARTVLLDYVIHSNLMGVSGGIPRPG